MTFKIKGQRNLKIHGYDHEFEDMKEEFMSSKEIVSYYYDYDEREYVVVTKRGEHYPAWLGPRSSWTNKFYKFRNINIRDIQKTMSHFEEYGMRGVSFYVNDVLKQYIDYREIKKLKKYIFIKIEKGGIWT